VFSNIIGMINVTKKKIISCENFYPMI